MFLAQLDTSAPKAGTAGMTWFPGLLFQASDLLGFMELEMKEFVHCCEFCFLLILTK